MHYSIASTSRIPGDEELGGQAGMDSLPFVMKLVRTEKQLQKVCELRSVAYGHHLPHLAAPLRIPDPLDRAPGTVVFLAEDKLTGEAIGTARLQSNTHQPLLLEASVDIPGELKRQALTEITRFSVRPGYNQFSTRQALIKACYLYCCAMQLPTILIGARRPLDRIYESLGYVDLFGDGRKIPLKHAGGIEHRVLKFDVYGAERNWHAQQHPLYQFMFRTHHPDIQVFSTISAGWSRPRRAPQAAVGIIDRGRLAKGKWAARTDSN
ncbi:MAG: hypothetical protein EOP38_07850 [Rubrivivax sp.]|nr:MAG: hypothetical protein EOP38_07850 [Rubrivivax sp.]